MIKSFRFLTALFAFAVVIAGAGANAQTPPTQEFYWNPNSEPDLAGYRVLTCASEPCSLANGVFLAETNATTLDVPEGSGFAFVLAFDLSGNVSPISNVVAYPIPTEPTDTTPPGAVQGFGIREK